MPVPDLRTLCVDLDITPNNLCVTFPGGAEICLSMPSLVPSSPTEMVQQLFAQLNAALAPLQPVFNIIDAVVAVFDCVKAISTLNPKEIVDCIPNLAEKVAALLRLIPQLSIPVLVVQFLDILILFLRGQKAQIESQAAYLARIIAAQTAATRPGNVGLARVIDCAQADFDNTIVWFNEGAAPLNRLIGLINLMLELAGLGKYGIPDVGNIDPDNLENTTATLDQVIEVIQQLRNLIAPLAGDVTSIFEDAAEAIEEE